MNFLSAIQQIAVSVYQGSDETGLLVRDKKGSRNNSDLRTVFEKSLPLPSEFGRGESRDKYFQRVQIEYLGRSCSELPNVINKLIASYSEDYMHINLFTATSVAPINSISGFGFSVKDTSFIDDLYPERYPNIECIKIYGNPVQASGDFELLSRFKKLRVIDNTGMEESVFFEQGSSGFSDLLEKVKKLGCCIIEKRIKVAGDREIKVVSLEADSLIFRVSALELQTRIADRVVGVLHSLTTHLYE